MFRLMVSAVALAAVLAASQIASAQQDKQGQSTGQSSGGGAGSMGSGGGARSGEGSGASERSGGGGKQAPTADKADRNAGSAKGATAERGRETSSDKNVGNRSASGDEAKQKGRNSTTAKGETEGGSATKRADEGHGNRAGKQAGRESFDERQDRKGMADGNNRTKDGAKQNRQADDNARRDDSKAGRAENRNDRNGTRTGAAPQQDQGANRTAEGAKGSKAAQAQLPDQQRERVQTVFRRENVRRANNVNFNVSIGQRIPRNVSIYAIPAAVISIVPQYRQYRYIAVNDDICIVDPGTYEIVYVINRGDNGSQQARRGNGNPAVELTLSPAEQRMVLDHIRSEGPPPRFSFQLGLGADVPPDVRLMTFDRDIVREIPRLERYRFVDADRSVLVVDPDSRDIVVIIDR